MGVAPETWIMLCWAWLDPDTDALLLDLSPCSMSLPGRTSPRPTYYQLSCWAARGHLPCMKVLGGLWIGLPWVTSPFLKQSLWYRSKFRYFIKKSRFKWGKNILLKGKWDGVSKGQVKGAWKSCDCHGTSSRLLWAFSFTHLKRDRNEQVMRSGF